MTQDLLSQAKSLWPGKEPLNLSGKTVLVTGGSRGFGFAIARQFAREGCRVAICAREADELAEAKKLLADEGFNDVITSVCDVSQQSQVEATLAEVTSKLGRIDILVNNAGIIQVGPVQAMEIKDFEQIMATNFWGTVYGALGVLPQMRERGEGHIVNIASFGGAFSVPHMLPYSSSKFAVTGFSEGLRAELEREGIKVHTILPGVLRNGSFLNAIFKGNEEKEYQWFTQGASTPGFAMDADKAALQVVEAVKRDIPRRTLTVAAQIGDRLHGLAPNLVQRLAALANRLILPRPAQDAANGTQGRDLYPQANSPIIAFFQKFGFAAERRFNQQPERTPTHKP